MGFWKSKLLPKIKKVFDAKGPKKTAAAAEACKSFDASKDIIGKEFEEKKTELRSKVVEIYEASSTDIKPVLKEPNEVGIKMNSPEVHKLLEQLVKINFPGSKQVCEASEKYGAALLSGPISYVFQKVSAIIQPEDQKPEAAMEEESSKGVEKADELVVKEEEEDKKEMKEEDKEVDEVAAEKPETAATAEDPKEEPKAEEETKN